MRPLEGAASGSARVITTRLGGRRTNDALMLLKGEVMATSDRTTGTRDEHYNVISVL
jgi:hypothetical protein